MITMATQGHYNRPHGIEDRHGVLVCKCGYLPRTTDYDVADAMLVQHIRDTDDHKCHWERYGQHCMRVRNHRGLHHE